MDEDKRKEIQLLIENSDNEKDSKLKKVSSRQPSAVMSRVQPEEN